MIVHKKSKHSEKTVCGLSSLSFPNVMVKRWGKVTCQNCRRLLASDELTFGKYSRACEHHVYEKELCNGQIKYISYCTLGDLNLCRRHLCPILNKETKK